MMAATIEAPTDAQLSYIAFCAIRETLMASGDWQRVQDKAQWEHMTPWGVLNEWPSLRVPALAGQEGKP